MKTSNSIPASSQAIDAGKKNVGRKRSIVTETLGFLLAVLVTAAGVRDSIAGAHLLDQVAAEHPGIGKIWVDGDCRHHLVEQAATLGVDMESTARKPETRGFPPIPNDGRWSGPTAGSAEPSPGPRLRRPPARSEAVIHLAMTSLVARRLTSESTISWRDPENAA
ncbi:hypothetical protein OHS17_00345 [Streptomyces sp. NBC_00523]|nr:hypothetical protein OHS17_00345 [Streptomyces sp. NBC_00523]